MCENNGTIDTLVSGKTSIVLSSTIGRNKRNYDKVLELFEKSICNGEIVEITDLAWQTIRNYISKANKEIQMT